MQLVAVMEAEVGALETWPTEILAIVFAFDPHGPKVNLHLQTLVAFFFGNNVPFNMACQFFSVCAYTPIPWIIPRFRYHYELFEQHRSQSRCPYYNVSEGRVKYTDGTVEGPHADLPTTLGFEATGFAIAIGCILMHAQRYEYHESAVY